MQLINCQWMQNVNVFYRESIPDASGSELTLLLLHGMRFSSKTWLELKTIQVISAAGYRVVAVDLPGFANTPKTIVRNRGQGWILVQLDQVFGNISAGDRQSQFQWLLFPSAAGQGLENNERIHSGRSSWTGCPSAPDTVTLS